MMDVFRKDADGRLLACVEACRAACEDQADKGLEGLPSQDRALGAVLGCLCQSSRLS